MGIDEQAWLKRTERALEEARSWEAWANELHLPGSGSDLFKDDALSRAFPTSTSAYHGISAGIDHVNFIGDAIAGRQATRPYAFFPPARAATFAAARTVWMLSPQHRRDRQMRGLWMEWDSNRKHKVMIDALRARDESASAVGDYLERLERHRGLLIAAASTIGRQLGNRHNPPRDTDIMQVATDWLDRNTTETFGPGHAAMILWRQHSGAAHSLPWINIGRAEMTEQLEDGSWKGRVTASYGDIGMAVASAVVMLREAKRLYEKRCA